MADDLHEVTFSTLFADSVQQVESRLRELGPFKRLSTDELKAYATRRIAIGWQIEAGMEDGSKHPISILASDDFPFARPLIAVPANRFLEWPHVEEDGVLCPLPDSSTDDPFAPRAVLLRLLGEASTLIEETLAGLRTDDFRTEFLSYWNRTAKDTPRLLSLTSKFDSTRLVSLWRGEQYYVFADSADQLRNWLSRRQLRDPRDFRPERAALIQLPAALIPHEYPNNPADLLAILRERCPSSLEILSPALTPDLKRLFVILCAPTKNGRALAALQVFAPSETNMLGRRIDVVNRGFRKGKAPPALVISRFLNSGSMAERFAVDRADPNWIHGRDHDQAAKKLQARKVVIMGIGSVGGFVAEHLACAGVGHLVLVDPELLAAANAGRHILGINSLGRSKAIGVAELLELRFPHHKFRGIQAKAQDFIREQASELADCDLVLCLTGDWSVDSFVNQWYLQKENRCRRVLFGWLEAHALAGHAVLLSNKSSCLGCHFSTTGKCDLTVPDWDESPLVQEPACGGIFQPYGPVELAAVNAMISSLALEGLFCDPEESLHRIYASNAANIESLRGRVTGAWAQVSPPVDPTVSSTRTLKWTKNLQCRCCGGM